MYDLRKEKEVRDRLQLMLSVTEEEFNNNPEYWITEGERVLKEYDDLIATRSV